MLALSISKYNFSRSIEQAVQEPSLMNKLSQSTLQLFVGDITVTTRLDIVGHLSYLVSSLIQPIKTLLGFSDNICVSVQRDSGEDDSERGRCSGQYRRLLFSTLLKIEKERMKEGADKRTA